MTEVSHVRFRTPKGEDLVVVPRDVFERLQDAYDAQQHTRSIARVKRKAVTLLTPAEARALLNATTPLAFWRHKRALTQVELAEKAGISQSYLASLESGRRKGDPALFKRLATALSVAMEDIVED